MTVAMGERGLSEHGYREQFRSLALSMLRFFLASRDGYRPEAPVAISVRFGDEEILVRPDDVLVNPGGGRTLRRVRTGHKGSKDAEDVAAAAFVLCCGPSIVPTRSWNWCICPHEDVHEVTLSPTKLRNREKKLAGFLADIRRGHFPAAEIGEDVPGLPELLRLRSDPVRDTHEKICLTVTG